MARITLAVYEDRAQAEGESIKVRENRIRRMAERQGLRLMKSRRRDPFASDYGKYWVETADRKAAPRFKAPGGLTLDEIEHRLTHPDA